MIMSQKLICWGPESNVNLHKYYTLLVSKFNVRLKRLASDLDRSSLGRSLFTFFFFGFPKLHQFFDFTGLSIRQVL